MEFKFLNRATWLVIVVSLAAALVAALIRT
jgi:type III secretory pathway component EscS